MPGVPTLDALPTDLHGKRVLVRVDLNVPVQDGRVTDATRIERATETLQALTGRGARVVLLSHFARPNGKKNAGMSLKPIVPVLQDVLGAPVAFAEDCIGPEAEAAVAALAPGSMLLLENLRFHPGEENNAPEFAHALARLGDLFVNDAFSCAHRAHASTEGLARLLPSVAGRLMEAELAALGQALEAPKRPVAAVIGGAKVSSKLDLLANLCTKVEVLAIGGGMANTFLAAQGIAVGASLCEHEMLDTARGILATCRTRGCDVVLPIDAVVASAFRAGVPSRVVPVGQVAAADMILDIGPRSIAALTARLADCSTVVWNGPLGAFEIAPFNVGTVVVARHVAELTGRGALRSVAGGGDTVAALAHAGVVDRFSYVSTAGGAFLEWLEGKVLPGVAVLLPAATAT